VAVDERSYGQDPLLRRLASLSLKSRVVEQSCCALGSCIRRSARGVRTPPRGRAQFGGRTERAEGAKLPAAREVASLKPALRASGSRRTSRLEAFVLRSVLVIAATG